MEELQESSSRLDRTLATYLQGQAQRLSRRSVMVTFGKIVLRVLGISLVPLLPLDRRFTLEAQAGTCSASQTCGMCGYFCKSCCGSTSVYSTCPSCLTKRGSWSGCCGTVTYVYTDCCGTATNARACKSSTFCGTYPTGDCVNQGYYAYCSSGETY